MTHNFSEFENSLSIDLNDRARRAFDLAIRTDLTVYLTGPTGSGKSTLAQEIHKRSLRNGGPFIRINLATLHEGTFESELFGHLRGAFTGAHSNKKGLLELADRGTVFLDEVGDLTPQQQSRLLDFLQSQQVRTLGSITLKQIDVRIIVATHRELESLVIAGRFREDLFFRLRQLQIDLLPISELDVPASEIASRMISSSPNGFSVRPKTITAELAHILDSHSWHGNLREMRHVLDYMTIACEQSQILSPDHLPQWFSRETESAAMKSLSKTYRDFMKNAERSYFENLLNRHQGKVLKSARQSGLSKSTFLRKLSKFSIKRTLTKSTPL